MNHHYHWRGVAVGVRVLLVVGGPWVVVVSGMVHLFVGGMCSVVHGVV